MSASEAIGPRDLPPETLRELLDYNPDTGRFHWHRRDVSLFTNCATRGAATISATWNTRFAGKEALTTEMMGYRAGYIFRHKYLAHRVAWVIVTGEWPLQVDHINGDRADNRWLNLREVTPSQNMRNQKRSCKNTSGVVGVHKSTRSPGKWVAAIGTDDGRAVLGTFDTKEEAIAVRKAAAAALGYSETHGVRT